MNSPTLREAQCPGATLQRTFGGQMEGWGRFSREVKALFIFPNPVGLS